MAHMICSTDTNSHVTCSTETDSHVTYSTDTDSHVTYSTETDSHVTCSTETDSCMTCSKKIRLFIICMQLQGFPIDSHTFVWVRRMIIVHNVVFLQILLLLWNKTYCTTWLYPMTVVAGHNTRSYASRAQWRCIHSRLFAKEVQHQCRHTTWGMLSTLMSLRHNKSRVEIHHYSIAYFYCITAFKALQHRNSVKGGAHTCRVDARIPDESTYHLWAPP